MWKRWLMIVVCLGLVIVRLLRPDLKVDVITVWLLVIATLFFLLPEMRLMTPYIKRIRVGDTEIELKEQIKDLGKKVERVEDVVVSQSEQVNVSAGPADETNRAAQQETISSDVEEIARILSASPRAALLLLSAKLEQQINRRLKNAGVEVGGRNATTTRLVEAGVSAGVFPPEFATAFRDFWSARTRIAHGAAPDIDDKTITSLVSIGLDLLRILAV